MACIDPEGRLSPSARKILEVLVEPKTVESVAAETALPFYRIRSGLREMVAAGLVEKTDSSYFITDFGRARMAAGKSG